MHEIPQTTAGNSELQEQY